MGSELGEKCVELARRVRDQEHLQDFGKVIAVHESNCLNCGEHTLAVEYEKGMSGAYCDNCHQEISQAIYEHEVGLLNSGYYG